MEAIENVCVRENETLRGRRARAHLPCKDRVEETVTPGAPVPPAVPGDFTVIIGAVMAGETLRGLEQEMDALGGAEVATAGLLSWFEFAEFEVRGLEEFEDLMEGLRLLRGAVMSVAASVVGRW